MKVGDFVRNEHHGLQRYGKVKKVLKNPKGDNWTYFIVDFVDDERYQKAVEHIKKTSKRDDYEPELYRADQIHSLDVSQTIQTLLKLQNSAE